MTSKEHLRKIFFVNCILQTKKPALALALEPLDRISIASKHSRGVMPALTAGIHVFIAAVVE
jgi:hypothetical protein